MTAGLPGPDRGPVMYSTLRAGRVPQLLAHGSCKPELGWKLGVHMQSKNPAASLWPRQPGSAPHPLAGAARPARRPSALGASESGLGTKLAANGAPAAPLMVTRVVSKLRSAPPFIVELCESAQPIEPHEVPRLDLFDLYHLYSHSKVRGEETRHSLRLGYFKEPGNAKAIAAYLARYFRHPLIVQIDATEIVSSLRTRFLPGKDVGASGTHSTVILATPPSLPIMKPADLPPQSPEPNGREGSVWSRLLDSLRRLQAAI